MSEHLNKCLEGVYNSSKRSGSKSGLGGVGEERGAEDAEKTQRNSLASTCSLLQYRIFNQCSLQAKADPGVPSQTQNLSVRRADFEHVKSAGPQRPETCFPRRISFTALRAAPGARLRLQERAEQDYQHSMANSLQLLLCQEANSNSSQETIVDSTRCFPPSVLHSRSPTATLPSTTDLDSCFSCHQLPDRRGARPPAQDQRTSELGRDPGSQRPAGYVRPEPLGAEEEAWLSGAEAVERRQGDTEAAEAEAEEYVESLRRRSSFLRAWCWNISFSCIVTLEIGSRRFNRNTLERWRETWLYYKAIWFN